MPHRVANFFRSSTSSLESQVSGLAKSKKSGANSSLGRKSADRNGRHSVTYASSVEGSDIDESHAVGHPTRRKMGESRTSSFSSDSHREREPGHHRILFPSMHFGRSCKETHISSVASLGWKLESPPIVLYGDAEHSTGALVSGQLFLDVKEDNVEIDSLNAVLNIHVAQKRPFANHCSDCATQVTELKKWSLVPNSLALKKGEHSFPFSVLLDGHLPATMDGPLVVITYEFKAEAIPKSAGVPQTAILFKKTLDVKRSLASSELPHHSVRVFPPTNIKASAQYPHVIHPIGTYNLCLKLDGISRHNANVDTIEYWKLKKLTWRLEETAKTVAPACGKHSPKLEGADEPQKKGLVRTETRVIGERTLFSGWKSNYMSPTDSTVELELEYSLAKHAKYACDTKSRDGTEVTHQLMVEMVVSQEWAPVNKPALVTHTGVGRILRMHFGTILTERAGIGISWDNEAPPIYQDVPPSPPAYFHEMMLDGESSIAELMEPLDPMTRESQERESTDSGASIQEPPLQGPPQ